MGRYVLKEGVFGAYMGGGRLGNFKVERLVSSTILVYCIVVTGREGQETRGKGQGTRGKEQGQETQKHRNTETQKHRNTETQKHRDTLIDNRAG